jgi:hypothetical protein
MHQAIGTCLVLDLTVCTDFALAFRLSGKSQFYATRARNALAIITTVFRMAGQQ